MTPDEKPDGPGSAGSGEPRSPEEIRADIEATREELGDTAAALAGKTDVKAQAKAKVEDVKHAAAETTDHAAAYVQENRRSVSVVAAAFVAGVVVGWLLTR